jgi:histidine triad (HIT) family protein
MSTLFDQIIDKKIPAKIVYEDEHIMAFHDIAPQAPIHILLIPKKPIQGLGDVTETDQAVLGKLLFKAKQLAQELAPNQAFRLVTNHGAEAGQSVFHLHFHLLIGRQFKWPPG